MIYTILLHHTRIILRDNKQLNLSESLYHSSGLVAQTHYLKSLICFIIGYQHIFGLTVMIEHHFMILFQFRIVYILQKVLPQDKNDTDSPIPYQPQQLSEYGTTDVHPLSIHRHLAHR